MKVALVVCPSHFHTLGVGYINAVLRADNHRVIPFDLEFLFETHDHKLFSRFIPLTSVYQERAINKVHFFLRPEIIFSSLFGTSSDMRKNAIPKEEREVISSVKELIPMFSEMILKSRPEMILFPTTVTNLLFSLLLAQNLKKKAKGIPVVFGGIGISAKQVQDVILNLKVVDYCIVGEGEEIIIDLLRRIETGKDASKTPGVACLVKKRFLYQPHAGTVNLDSLPYPDLDDLPFSGANIKLYAKSIFSFAKQFIPIAASRWCVNKCIFCFESINKQNYRIRKAESVIDEIVKQSKKYKSDSFWLCDSTFNINLAWLERFCDLLIKENIRVRFKFVHLCPNRLSFKLLNKMHQAGFQEISYGVESFSSKVLHSLCKYNDVNEMKKVLIDTAGNKIKSGFGLIYNSVGQKKEDISKNMDEILSMEGELHKRKIDAIYVPNYTYAPLRIDPHSAIFKNIKKYGITLSPYRLHLPPKARRIERLINKTLFNWEAGINLQDTVKRFNNMLNVIHFRTASRYSKSVIERAPLP